MKNILDNHVKAYQGNNTYDFDNEIILKWYPHRVIKFADNAKSILELGLGHGFSTDILSRHFSRYLVLDGSAAVIENFKKKYPYCSAEILEAINDAPMAHQVSVPSARKKALASCSFFLRLR